MTNYQDPYISTIDMNSDFDKIGEWTLEEMGQNPFFYFKFNGNKIPHKDTKLCADTGGDCVKWINSYI